MEKEKSLAEAGLFLYGMADADASGTVAVWPKWGGMSGPDTAWLLVGDFGNELDADQTDLLFAEDVAILLDGGFEIVF